MMKPPAIRVTALPRTDHPNSGLQAMHFAKRYGDEVWAIPAPGSYLGDYGDIRFSAFEADWMERLFPARLLRRLAVLSTLFRMLVRPSRFYFIHSFIFAVPAYLLRKRYCIFIHGSDRRYLETGWGKAVAGGASNVFGVGFGLRQDGLSVTEVPNIFIPAEVTEPPEIRHDLVFVLRDAPVKNPYYPIELAEQLTDLDLDIVAVGLGPDELPESYRERLSALQQRGCRIRYVGRQPYDEVVRLMHASRMLMIPSFSEGIPKVLLEAMSLGLHVVANASLVFPPELTDCVDPVALNDWASIGEIVSRERRGERKEANVRRAGDYLLKSQKALLSLYDDIYIKQFGFVPSGARTDVML